MSEIPQTQATDNPALMAKMALYALYHCGGQIRLTGAEMADIDKQFDRIRISTNEAEDVILTLGKCQATQPD